MTAPSTYYLVDITASLEIIPSLAKNLGIAGRAQGLSRYYALLLGTVQIVRLVKRDDSETILAETPFRRHVFKSYALSLTARGDTLTGTVDGAVTPTATNPRDWLSAGGADSSSRTGRWGRRRCQSRRRRHLVT
jgi:hypothetical protein